MAPKGGNAKKEAGRAKKAENEAKKAAAAEAERERKEAEKWSEGAKSSKSKEERRRNAAEKARLLAEEEANAPSTVKTAPRPARRSGSQDVKPAGPGAIAAGGGLGATTVAADEEKPREVESYSATGLDNALDLLEVRWLAAANIERHPENADFMRAATVKAAFEAYKEPPGLRLQQYHDLLYKQFQKSPENPFNQVTVAYDASKDERMEALNRRNAEIAERLREKK
ncbi:hypothetical protein BD414DRAFT_503996 [Trametes punicea]|nr:hypothetical protein BD414DRAFT_503996 [Trametes punicea]